MTINLPDLHEQPWLTAQRMASRHIDDALEDSVQSIDDAVGWAQAIGERDLSETLEGLAGKVRAAKRTLKRAPRKVTAEAARYR